MSGADSNQIWEAAEKEFKNQNYQGAIAKLRDFTGAFPADPRVNTAKVLIVNSELRLPYDQGDWDKCLIKTESVLPGLDSILDANDASEAFIALRDDLSLILPETAQGFADEALEMEDIEEKRARLVLAKQAFTHVQNSSYVPTSLKQRPGTEKRIFDVTATIKRVERQLSLEEDYATTLVEIQTLAEDGETRQAFDVYHRLLQKYPELQIRSELRDLMQTVSNREIQLVQTLDFVQPELPAPTSSVVSTTVFAPVSATSQAIPGVGSEVLVKLIRGVIYGIRASDGAVIWQHPVGEQTKMSPIWTGTQLSSDVIAVDARSWKLLRIDPMEGTVVWEFVIGESFHLPNIVGGFVNVTTRSGKVFRIDVERGECGKIAVIPQQAPVSGVVVDRAPYIYQLGDRGNLYVLSTETMECVEVFYLAHRSGSIGIAPFVLNGHMLIVENGPDFSMLHVLASVENGLNVVKAQRSTRLLGQVNTPMLRFQRWAMLLTDIGLLRMIEVNLTEGDEDPMAFIASGELPRRRKHTQYLLGTKKNLWIAGAGLRRLRVKRAQNEFSDPTVNSNLDDFICPMDIIDETLFHTRQRDDSALISVSAVDTTSFEEKWRTDFAAAAAGHFVFNDQLRIVSAQGDVGIMKDHPNFPFQAIVHPETRASNVEQDLDFKHVLKLGDDRFIGVGVHARSSFLLLTPESPLPSNLVRLQGPAGRTCCPPVALKDSLLVLTKRGQVLRLDVNNGSVIGDPFQPPIQPNVDFEWRAPAVLEGNERVVMADADGMFYLVSSEDREALKKLAEYQHPGMVLSAVVAGGKHVYAVCREEEKEVLISLQADSNLALKGSVDLPGGFVEGPWFVNDLLLVKLDSGKLVCFDHELQQQWLIDLPRDRVAGAPIVMDGQLAIAFESGDVVHYGMKDGVATNTLRLGRPISSAPFLFKDRYYVLGLNGELFGLESP